MVSTLSFDLFINIYAIYFLEGGCSLLFLCSLLSHINFTSYDLTMTKMLKIYVFLLQNNVRMKLLIGRINIY